jgi:hypothetical protein
MKATDEVKEFLEGLKGDISIGSALVDIVNQDEKDIRVDVTDRILSRMMQLDGSWRDYALSSVDIIYDEDPLRLTESLERYGIIQFMPVIRGQDTGMIFVYRFILPDAYGRVYDSIGAFHVILRQANGVVRTRRIVVYG